MTIPMMISDESATEFLSGPLMSVFKDRGIWENKPGAKIKVWMRPRGQISEIGLSGKTWGISWLRSDPNAIAFIAAAEEVLHALIVRSDDDSQEAQNWVADALWLLNEIEV